MNPLHILFCCNCESALMLPMFASAPKARLTTSHTSETGRRRNLSSIRSLKSSETGRRSFSSSLRSLESTASTLQPGCIFPSGKEELVSTGMVPLPCVSEIAGAVSTSLLQRVTPCSSFSSRNWRSNSIASSRAFSSAFVSRYICWSRLSIDSNSVSVVVASVMGTVAAGVAGSFFVRSPLVFVLLLGVWSRGW